MYAWIEKRRKTSKVALVNQASSFVNHLYSLLGQRKEREERNTQRPKIAMVVIDKKDGDGRLGDDCRTLLAAVEYFISFTTTVNTIWDVWSSFSIFRLLMLCAVSTLRL